jgi:hypothetical protein
MFVHVREADDVPLQKLTSSSNSSPTEVANVGAGKYFRRKSSVARCMLLSAVCRRDNHTAFSRSGDAGKIVW